MTQIWGKYTSNLEDKRGQKVQISFHIKLNSFWPALKGLSSENFWLTFLELMPAENFCVFYSSFIVIILLDQFDPNLRYLWPIFNSLSFWFLKFCSDYILTKLDTKIIIFYYISPFFLTFEKVLNNFWPSLKTLISRSV